MAVPLSPPRPLAVVPPVLPIAPPDTAPRPIRGPLAPASCLTLEPCFACDAIRIVATDPRTGEVRVEITVARAEAAWWCKVARYFLAWRYGAAEIRIVRDA